jgi:MFS family permease
MQWTFVEFLHFLVRLLRDPYCPFKLIQPYSFGKAYQVFALKPVFLACIGIFTLGVTVCTAAPTSATFIVGRAIVGLANAGVGNGAITILSRLFPLEKRALWFGIIGGVQSVALVSAPLIGGALIDAFTWRACFGVNIPLAVASFGLVAFGFREDTSVSSQPELSFRQKLLQLDLFGTLIIIPCVTCLLLALQWGGTRYGWNNAVIISLLVTFGVLLVGFAFMQYKSGDKATLPPKILKNRNILGGAWFTACCDGALGVTEYYIAIYFQGVRGFTATRSGVLGLPMIIGLMISSVATGIGISSLGYYTRNPVSMLYPRTDL